MNDEDFGNLVEASKKLRAAANVIPKSWGLTHSKIDRLASDLEFMIKTEREERIKEAQWARKLS